MNHLQELKMYIGYATKSMGSHITGKSIWSVVLTMFTFLFGLHMNAMLEALLALMVIDMITGMMKSARSGEAIESRKALRSAIKLGVYAMLISSTHIVVVVLPGNTFLDQGMVIFLVITEFISIIENIGKMGFPVPQVMLQRILSLEWAKPARLEDFNAK